MRVFALVVDDKSCLRREVCGVVVGDSRREVEVDTGAVLRSKMVTAQRLEEVEPTNVHVAFLYVLYGQVFACDDKACKWWQCNNNPNTVWRVRDRSKAGS